MTGAKPLQVQFDGLKRIAKDDTANANKDLIEHAYRMGYLFGEREYKFLIQTRRSRSLSLKQIEWKRKINRRIINQTIVKKRSQTAPKILSEEDI